MTRLKIMTFNVENMLVRFNFREWENERLATLLDVNSNIDRANLIRTQWNMINEGNRVATALTIRIGSRCEPHNLSSWIASIATFTSSLLECNQ